MQVPWLQTQSKAYRLWDLESKSLFISSDVHFVESKLNDSRILLEFMVEILAASESPILVQVPHIHPHSQSNTNFTSDSNPSLNSNCFPSLYIPASTTSEVA